ncbi:MAG: DUF4974 domain-containing protein [Cyclobacteriaceae bacterium]
MLRKELIDKFYRGECTKEEVQQLLHIFDTPQQGERSIEALWEKYPLPNNNIPPHTQRAFSAIRKKTDVRERNKTTHLLVHSQWLRVAAILLIAFSLPLLLLPPDDIEISTPTPLAVITKENPPGQKSVIRLPDGTQVHLNAQSSLSFPEAFIDSTRTVHLQGEAFFEVVENAEQPFIVSASGVNTRALGTSFNVKAYAQEDSIQVVLASGKVGITQTVRPADPAHILMPGEGITVNRKTQSMEKYQADLRQVLAWKNNILLFQHATSSEVFTALERWYGVKITYATAAPAKAWRFTGEFHDESLENVLLSISYVKSFQYTLDHNTLTITP